MKPLMMNDAIWSSVKRIGLVESGIVIDHLLQDEFVAESTDLFRSDVEPLIRKMNDSPAVSNCIVHRVVRHHGIDLDLRRIGGVRLVKCESDHR